MTQIVFSASGARTVDDASIANILTRAQSPEVSIAKATLSGIHGPTINVKSTRVYYVISGDGMFSVGSERVQARRDDVVLVPRGVEHGIEGTIEYLVINTPAFDPDDERQP